MLADRSTKWSTCSLSNQPLQAPIVADFLGSLYNRQDPRAFHALSAAGVSHTCKGRAYTCSCKPHAPDSAWDSMTCIVGQDVIATSQAQHDSLCMSKCREAVLEFFLSRGGAFIDDLAQVSCSLRWQTACLYIEPAASLHTQYAMCAAPLPEPAASLQVWLRTSAVYQVCHAPKAPLFSQA